MKWNYGITMYYIRVIASYQKTIGFNIQKFAPTHEKLYGEADK